MELSESWQGLTIFFMNDETEILTSEEVKKPKRDHSHFFGLSVRGFITLSVVWCVIVMSLRAMKVEEPLYSLVNLCVGYYFGAMNPTATKPVKLLLIGIPLFLTNQ